MYVTTIFTKGHLPKNFILKEIEIKNACIHAHISKCTQRQVIKKSNCSAEHKKHPNRIICEIYCDPTPLLKVFIFLFIIKINTLFQTPKSQLASQVLSANYFNIGHKIFVDERQITFKLPICFSQAPNFKDTFKKINIKRKFSCVSTIYSSCIKKKPDYSHEHSEI